MRRPCRLSAAAVLLTLPLGGCIRTVADIVTAPVKIAGKAVDMATTSQSEADEKRGRDIRRQEERLGKLDRDYRRALRDCEDGERAACRRADDLRAQMDEIRHRD